MFEKDRSFLLVTVRADTVPDGLIQEIADVIERKTGERTVVFHGSGDFSIDIKRIK